MRGAPDREKRNFYGIFSAINVFINSDFKATLLKLCGLLNSTFQTKGINNWLQ